MAATLGDALLEAWGNAGARRRQRPPARSPMAMFNELTRSARGQEALVRAGVSAGPGARNWRAWLSGERSPSKANRERIADAYRDWFGPSFIRTGLGNITSKDHNIYGIVCISGDCRDRGNGRAPLRVECRYARPIDWERVERLWLTRAPAAEVQEAWVFDVLMRVLPMSEPPEFPGPSYTVRLT